MKLFERILGRTKKQIILTPTNSKSIVSQTIYPSYAEGYFVNGEWRTKRKCCPEYDMGSDSIIGGCGFVQEISENDIDVQCEIYMWKCEKCGYWHAIAPHFIPDNAKHRIRNRSPYYHKNVVDFEKYKKTR